MHGKENAPRRDWGLDENAPRRDWGLDKEIGKESLRVAGIRALALPAHFAIFRNHVHAGNCELTATAGSSGCVPCSCPAALHGNFMSDMGREVLARKSNGFATPFF